jgi:release factor glutamine methyltransferase
MIAAQPRLSVSSLLREGESAFGRAGIPTPRLDAEVLLAAVMSVTRAGLYARLRDPVGEAACAHYRAAVERRRRREPVAYITGSKEFSSLVFKVTPAVLIPRPETEQVVETAIRLLADHPAPLVCDAGTGSGCIAVAIAHALPRARLVAADMSAAALRVARLNARRHGVTERMRFVAADLLSALAERTRFDLIVSNPPYLTPEDAVSPEVDWEPREALAAGADGLDVIRRLVRMAPHSLHDRGALVIEIGNAQERAVLELAREAGFESTRAERDLGGHPRVVVARRSA